jgi:hypothetical protein
MDKTRNHRIRKYLESDDDKKHKCLYNAAMAMLSGKLVVL